MNVLEKHLATILSRNWWVLLLRGLAAIAFGVLTWLLPGVSLTALVLLFGIYALADGILGVWTGIAGRKEHEDWWVMLMWGLLGIGIGILTLAAPGITALALLFAARWPPPRASCACTRTSPAGSWSTSSPACAAGRRGRSWRSWPAASTSIWTGRCHTCPRA